MRKAIREVKNVMMQFNEIELKVREATNNDAHVVTTNKLAQIARATNDYQEYPSLFSMLWKRLTDLEHVRHVQKALIVVEYLLRHGAERFINDAKRRARDIAALQKYKHYNEDNQDDAKEARARAKAVYALLMDDQLLASERAKAQRLMAENRLSGAGTYDEAAEDEPYNPAIPAHYDNEDNVYEHEPRNGGNNNHYNSASSSSSASAAYASAVQQQQQHHSSSSSASASNASLGRSVVLRRRSVDEDPFNNPVIPNTNNHSNIATSSSSSSTTTSKKPKSKPQELDVDEPQDESAPTANGGDAAEEDEEARQKRIKKEKKKKKKEEEAKRAAAEEAAQQQQQQQQHPPKQKHVSFNPNTTAKSSSSSSAAASSSSLLDDDIMKFHDSHPSQQGEVDILTGGFGGSNSGASGDNLSELFANSSIHDGNQSPLFDHYTNNNNHSNNSINPFPDEGSMDPGLSLSPHFSSQSASSSSSPFNHNSNNVSTPTLVNLNDINAPRQDQRKQDGVDAGVTMNMMRSIQPLGAPVKSDSGFDNSRRRSNVPASVPIVGVPDHRPQMNGFMYGIQPAYAAAGYGMMPTQQANGPILAIMPPGAAPIAAPSMITPLNPYGGNPAFAMQPAYNSNNLPFNSPTAATFTQMRQGPKQSIIGGSNSIPIFEVPEAQVKAVEPTNYVNGNANGKRR